jgi:hypothetical protein
MPGASAQVGQQRAAVDFAGRGADDHRQREGQGGFHQRHRVVQQRLAFHRLHAELQAGLLVEQHQGAVLGSQ